MARLHVTIYAEDAHLDRVLESSQTVTVVIGDDVSMVDVYELLDSLAARSMEQLRRAAIDLDVRRRSLNERTA